jgi:hypothetical protein
MTDEKKRALRFSLRRLVSTPGALAAVPPDEMLEAVTRHALGDWGDCCPEDAAENDFLGR